MAVKVDAFHEHGDGSIGRSLREEVERKLDRLQEPPPVKAIKPLAAPLEAPRKKRGGKRVRRMKERYALTEMRKQQNRMTFGQIEEDAYQEDLGYTRGIMGKGGPGRIRGPTVDEKTKVGISKTLQRNLQRQQAYGGTTTIKRQVAGTASSVAFTPLQVTTRIRHIKLFQHCADSIVICAGVGNCRSPGSGKEGRQCQILFKYWNLFQCQRTRTWPQFFKRMRQKGKNEFQCNSLLWRLLYMNKFLFSKKMIFLITTFYLVL